MPNHRHIREAAIQLLYTAHLEESPLPDSTREAFWNLILEKQSSKHTHAVAKALQHLAQGRKARLDQLEKHQDVTLSIVRSRVDSEKFTAALEDYYVRENDFSILLEAIKPEHHQDHLETLQASISALYLKNRHLAEQRSRIQKEIDIDPEYRKKLEGTQSALLKLQRLSERIMVVERPEDFPNEEKETRLIESQQEIDNLKNEANTLVDRVLAQATEFDSRIEAACHHYTIERINPIDKAIIRMALLDFADGKAVAATINGAIECAKRFCSQDSGRFVNGILDQMKPSSTDLA